MDISYSSLEALPLHPLVALALFVAVYFLPCIIAGARNMRHAGAITVLNFVAGWTFVGWVVALTWACLDKPPPEK